MSKANVLVSGQILAAPGAVDGRIGELIIKATGENQVRSAVALNAGTTVVSAAASNVATVRTVNLASLPVSVGDSYGLILINGANRADVVHIAQAGDTATTIAAALAAKVQALTGYTATSSGTEISINNAGTHDITFFVTETRPSGFVELNTRALPASKFDIRAALDINITVTEANLVLNGFIGGLTGFNPARDIRIDVQGGNDLRVLGGIINATHDMNLSANNLVTEGAAVFLANTLSIATTGSIQANTRVTNLFAVSSVAGNILINEATNLHVRNVVAQDGSITIGTGGDQHVHNVLIMTDKAGNDIMLNSSKNMHVDYAEAGVLAGAQKQHGRVTVDAKGTLYEMAPYDNDRIDLYGYEVVVRGTTAAAITELSNPSIRGVDQGLEVLSTKTGGGLSVDPVSHLTGNNPTFTAAASVQATAVVLQAAGVDAFEVQSITFSGEHGLGERFVVTVGSTEYTVTVGETVNGVVVAQNLPGILQALAFKLAQDARIGTAVVHPFNPVIAVTAATANIALPAISVVVIRNVTSLVENGVTNDFAAPVTPAGENRLESREVLFVKDVFATVNDQGETANSLRTIDFAGLPDLASGRTFTIDFIPQDGEPIQISYTAVSGATAAQVAAGLAGAINADAAFTAAVDGTVNTRINITAGAGLMGVDSPLLISYAGPEAGLTYTVTLEGVDYSFSTGENLLLVANNFAIDAIRASVVKELNSSVTISPAVPAPQVTDQRTIDLSALQLLDAAQVDHYVFVIQKEGVDWVSVTLTPAQATSIAEVATAIAAAIHAEDGFEASATDDVITISTGAGAVALAVNATAVKDGDSTALTGHAVINPIGNDVVRTLSIDSLALADRFNDNGTYTVRLTDDLVVTWTGAVSSIDALATALASQISNQSGYFATANSGVISITGAGLSNSLAFSATARQLVATASDGIKRTDVTTAVAGRDLVYLTGSQVYALQAGESALQYHLQSGAEVHTTAVTTSFAAAVTALVGVVNDPSKLALRSSTVNSWATLYAGFLGSVNQTTGELDGNGLLHLGDDRFTYATETEVVGDEDVAGSIRVLHKTVNTAFTLTASVTNASNVVQAGRAEAVLLQPAGSEQAQVNRIDLSTTVGAGYRYTLLFTTGGVQKAAVVSVGDTVNGTVVQNNLPSVLTALVHTINGITAAGVTASIDANSLVLTAQQTNTPFTVDTVLVINVSNQAVTPAPLAAVTQAAGTAVAQQSQVTFDGDASASVRYDVRIGTALYSVQPGVGDDSGVAANWAAILGALKGKIDAGGLMTATVDSGNKRLTLTAVLPNTAYPVSASGVNMAVLSGSAPLPGDHILIISERDNVGGGYSFSAGGDLTLVTLETNPAAGETINLSAGNDLVIVEALNVGASGTLKLAAGGGIALGGAVTAGLLDVTASRDLAITTNVNTLKLEMTGNGNVVVDQTGSLTIDTLNMAGGNLTLIVRGDLNIGTLGGTAGSLTIMASGNVSFGNQATAALGNVTITGIDGAPNNGSITGALNATGLDLRTTGEVNLSNTGSAPLTVSRLETGGQAITLHSAGEVTVNSALNLSGAANLNLSTSSGAINLNRELVSGTGVVNVSAANGLVLSEAADITSASGNVTLNAGSGALSMTSQTWVQANSGVITLNAVGNITVGKLRSTADVLNITSTGGAVLDAGDGPVDIGASNATLVIRSAQGVGHASLLGGTLEIDVAKLDLINTSTGGVWLENTGSLEILRLDQQANGVVNIHTLNGAITTGALNPVDKGVKATTGQVNLYAGGVLGQIRLNTDILTTGGGVALTAEGGDITLAAGIRVDGIGLITLRSTQGAVVSDLTKAQEQWLTTVTAPVSFNTNIDWAMRRGHFTVNTSTGQIVTQGIDAFNASTRIANGVVLRSADGAFIQTQGRLVIEAQQNIGDRVDGFLFSPLALVVDVAEISANSSSGKPITVLSTGTTSVVESGSGDVSGSRGGSTGVSSLNGSQIIDNPMDASGQDIFLVADVIQVNNEVRSAGANLTIRTIDQNRPIILGDFGVDGSTTNALHLSIEELSRLQPGFTQIVIGDQNSASTIRVVGGIGESGERTAVVIQDNLVLKNPQTGGHVYIDADLLVRSLHVIGSGNTTTLSGNVTALGDLTYEDSVKINGNITVKAGVDPVTSIPNPSGGNIVFGTSILHSLNGDGEGAADHLTLVATDAAGRGNIRFSGQVGNIDPLASLTIQEAKDVTFDQGVVVNGNLIINASGTVTFRDNVTINNGGSLIINGATSVVFATGQVILNGNNGGKGGDILLEANNITLPGTDNAVIANGNNSVLTMRPTDLLREILVASPTGGTANTLNLSNTLISRIDVASFATVVIGHKGMDGHARAGTGAVRIGAINTADQFTFLTDVEIYGGSITVEDFSSPAFIFAVDGSLKLDARNNILVRNEVQAKQGITLISATGSVQQANPDNNLDGLLNEAIRTTDLVVRAATGVVLPWTEINTLDVQNTTSGNVLVNVFPQRSTVFFPAPQITGHVEVIRLHQTAGDGNVTLTTDAGNIVLRAPGAGGQGVQAQGGGNITITAGGAASTIDVQQAISAVTGIISLSAGGQLSTTGAGVITATGAGPINLTSRNANIAQATDVTSVGGTITYSAATDITMANGTRTDAGAGSIVFTAGNHIALSTLFANTAITLTADHNANGSGWIRQATGFDGAYNLDGETSTVTLNATTGIGESTRHLKTRIAGLQFNNTAVAGQTAAGGVFIEEATDLVSTGTSEVAGSAGDISLVSLAGHLTLSHRIETTGGSGNVLLDARSGNVNINQAVRSTSGNVSVLAAQNIVMSGASAEVRTSEAGKTIDLLATAGVITTMRVQTNQGNIRAQAGSHINLGVLDARSAVDRSLGALSNQASWGSVSLIAGEAITDTANDGDTTVDIFARALRMQAGTAIGTGANRIETEVHGLSASAQAGGIYLTESTAATVGSVADVVVNRVAPTGSVSNQPGVAGADLAGLLVSGNHNLMLITKTGTLTLADAVSIMGDGNILIEAEMGGLQVDAAISTNDGNITVLSGGSQTYTAAGDITTTGGTIDVQAYVVGSSITMEVGTVFSTVGRNIRVVAAADISLGVLDARTDSDRTGGGITQQASWGGVSVISGGSILDAGSAGNAATNIYANALRLTAQQAIGASNNHLNTEVQLLSAVTTEGDLFLTDASAITIGQTPDLVVQRLLRNGVFSPVSNGTQSNLSSAGHLVLQTAAGSITTEAAGGAVTAAGNLLLKAGGASSDITLGASVLSSGGHISLDAGRDIVQNANITASGEGKTIDLLAGDDILMGDTTSTTSNDGNIRLQAHNANTADAGTNGIALAVINAGTGHVALIAGTDGSITDVGTNPSAVNITAADLILQAGAGIGSGTNHIETTVVRLAAQASSGGMFITETDGVTVDSLSVTVERVAADASASTTAADTGEDLRTTSDGAIVLKAGGDVVLNAGTASTPALLAAGSGNVLLDVTGGLTLNAAVEAGSGHVSLVATGTLTQAAAGDIVTSGTGTIDVRAHAIDMVDGATADAQNGNIRYVSTTTLALGGLSTLADVSLSAETITDSNGAALNVVADELRIVTTGAADGQGAGSSADHLEISVNRLAANVAGTGTGGLFLTEADAITIGTLNAINVNQVGLDGTTLTATADAAQSDLNSAGHLVLQTTAGSITTEAGGAVSAADNLLLKAGDASSDITLGASVLSSGGHISLDAGRDIVQNANITASGEGKTIDLLAGDDILMGAATSTTSTNGNIRLQASNANAADAANNGIALAVINAGTGHVALIAGVGGSITDVGTNPSAVNITAADLILQAGAGIGSGTNHIETTVTRLAAQASSGGMFITEANAVMVDALSFDIRRVDSEAATGAINSAGEDLRTTGDGAIVLRAGGDVVLNPGTASTPALVAAGSGNVLLDVTGGLTLNAGVDAGSGHISLAVSGALTQAAAGDIVTSGTGSINVRANAIDMADGATADAQNGNIRYLSTTTLALGGLSTLADVSLSAETITDSNGAALNVVADELRIVTTGAADGQGAGSSADHLEISVNRLAANVAGTGTGGLFLTEADAITVGTLNAITVKHVLADGSVVKLDESASEITDESLGNLISAGHLVLQTLAGSITTEAAGGEIEAAGNVLLQAGGASSDITLGASVLSTDGHISVEAGQDIVQNADITAGGAGNTIDLLAGDDILMGAATSTTSNDGNIRLQAGNANAADAANNGIALAVINAGTGHVALIAGVGGSITDVGTNPSAVNITAADLILQAGAGIGSGTNHIETTVTRLAAQASSGGMFITEANAVMVDALSFDIRRVDSEAATGAINSAGEDLRTTGDGAIVLRAGGDVVLNPGTAGSPVLVAEGSGNVLLDVTGGLTLNAGVDAGSGHISLAVSGALTQAAAGDIVTSGTGSIDVRANAIEMADGATADAQNGNIRYVSTTTLALGGLSTTADVSLSAETITDSNGAALNVVADELRIVTTGAADGQGAGTSADHLEISVNRLAANVAGTGTGGLFLTEANAITLGTLNAINVNQVGLDGTTLTATADAAQSDLNSAGHLVLQTTAGSITTEAAGGAVTAAGNLLLKAGDATSDITLGASVLSSAGHISVHAGRDLLQNAHIVAQGAGNTIDVQAVRAITMADGALATTNNGNIRYMAKPSGAATTSNVVTLGGLHAGTGNVSIVAGSILDGGDVHTDIIASNLRMNATVGIGNNGTTVNAIDTQVVTLSASSRVNGVFINEADALIIDTVAAITVNTVAGNATVSNTTDAQQEDVTTINDGAVVIEADSILVSQGANIANSRAVDTTGTGNVLLHARAGSLNLQGQVLGGTGHVGLVATGDIQMRGIAGIVSTNGSATGATIYAKAGGAITMDSGATVTSSNGHVRYEAVGNINLALINAGSGNVALVSTAGSVLDNQTPVDNTNVLAAGLLINAHSGVGVATNRLETTVTTLTANSAAGSIFLHDTTSVATGQVTTTVQQVGNTAGLTTVTRTQTDVMTTTGAIVLSAATDLTLNDGDSNGKAIVSTSGSIRLTTTAGTGRDILMNAAVDAGSGNVTIIAQRDLRLQNAMVGEVVASRGDILTTAGSVDLTATTGTIAMADGTRVQTNGGNIRVDAATNVVIGLLDARVDGDRAGSLTAQNTWGDVQIRSGSGAITDAAATADTAVDVFARALRMQAGTAIGAATNHIETEVITLAARASNGGIFVTESSAVTVDSVADVVVDRVDSAGVTTETVAGAALSDLVTAAGNGNIVLLANGSVTLNDGTGAGNTNGSAVVAHGSGSILLQATGAGSDLIINSDVRSTTGHITLKAADGVFIGSATATGVDVATAALGTVSINAEEGALTMAGDAHITASGSSARLRAQGDITVGNITATNVSLDSDAGSLINAAGSTMNVTATNLRLQAEGAIGAATRHLTTSVDVLSALAGTGSIFITEANGVTVDDVTVTVREFNANASTSNVTDAAQSDLTTGDDGDIVLVATLGDIVLNDGTATNAGQAVSAHGTGSIRLEATAGSVTANTGADILSGSGDITLRAGQNLSLGDQVDVATANPGTISLNAVNGSLTMAGNSNVTASGSSARLAAQGDITVGNINADEVSLLSSTGSLINAAGSTMNVTAENLRLQAQGSIGAANRHLSTDVDVLSALAASGSIFITEANGVTIDDVTVTVREFNANASTSNVTDAAQSDLTTGDNGDIVLVATLGNIVLNDGTATNPGQAVSAHGSGSILLDAAGSLTANSGADILSGSGDITARAGQSIVLGEQVDVETSSTGTISLNALNGSLTMAGNSNVTATGSSARLAAQGDITVGNISADDVSLLSHTGSLINATGSTMNVTAENLRLQAQGSIGAANRHLSTSVDVMSALAETGSIFITEANGVTVDDVTVTVREFNADATTTTVTDAAQSDLTTGDDGDIVLVATLGDIVLNDGTATNAGQAVSAHGTGSIRLEATAGSLTANTGADILSGSGDITARAGQSIVLGEQVDVETSSTGTISLNALNGSLTMAGNSNVTATGSSARLAAQGDITVGNINADEVSLLSSTGSLINAAGSTMNVTADNLRLQAQGSIGAANRHLSTDVDVMSALAETGDLFITEANGVTVDDVTVTVREFNADATTTTVTDAAQSDLTTGDDGDIVLVATLGDIVLNDGTATNAGQAVSANGSGSIRLDAAAGSLTANTGADILSGTGDIIVLADQDVSIDSAEIVSDGTGSVVVHAVNGSVALSADSLLNAGSGDITVSADQDVSLGSLLTMADGKILVEAGRDLVAGGVIQSDSDITLEAGQDLHIGADIVSDGGISLQAGRDLLVGGEVDSGTGITMDAGRDIDLRSGVESDGLITLKADQDIFVGGGIESITKVTLEAGGVIRGDGSSEVKADSLVMKGLGPQPGDGLPVKTDVNSFELDIPRGLVSTITRPDGSLSFVVFVDGKVHQQSSNVDSTVTRVTDVPSSGTVTLPPPRVLPQDVAGPVTISFEDALAWIRAYRASLPASQPDDAENGEEDVREEGEELGVMSQAFAGLTNSGDEADDSAASNSRAVPRFNLQGEPEGDSFDQLLSLDAVPDESSASSGSGDPADSEEADPVSLTFVDMMEFGQMSESLEVAYLLGEPANQPWGAGVAVNDAFYFDYWVDNLAV